MTTVDGFIEEEVGARVLGIWEWGSGFQDRLDGRCVTQGYRKPEGEGVPVAWTIGRADITATGTGAARLAGFAVGDDTGIEIDVQRTH